MSNQSSPTATATSPSARLYPSIGTANTARSIPVSASASTNLYGTNNNISTNPVLNQPLFHSSLLLDNHSSPSISVNSVYYQALTLLREPTNSTSSSNTSNNSTTINNNNNTNTLLTDPATLKLRELLIKSEQDYIKSLSTASTVALSTAAAAAGSSPIVNNNLVSNNPVSVSGSQRSRTMPVLSQANLARLNRMA